MDNKLFLLRDLTKEDLPFLYNSFLKSYRDSPAVKSVPNSIYYAGQHAIIETIIASPHATIFIACNPDDIQQIYGYALGEMHDTTAVVHWIYCKHPFRGNGIGTALVGALIKDAQTIYYTHRVKNIEKLLGDRPFIFNPYAATMRPAA